MNVRATCMAAVLAAASLLAGLVAAVPPAAAAGTPGTITTVAGGPGRGPARKVFQAPQALAAGPGGVLYVGDGQVVRAFSNTRSWENVFAGTGGIGYSGNGSPATGAQVSAAAGLAVDSSGNVLIADSDNGRIRVVATSAGTFFGRAMTAGDIYTVAGNGKFGFSGDGGPATSAALQFPSGVAVDPAGNIVIADSDNGRIRVVAEKTGMFYDVAMTAGDIYTVAGDGTQGFAGDGGPATSAELSSPQDVVVDAAGNLVIADFENQRIRVVAEKTGMFYGVAMTAGDIYTVAGNGTFGFSGDGGPATSAELSFPTGVAVDPAGNLAIADFGNGRIRVVAAKTGTFYGQAMTAGDIYTVAGDGGFGFPHSGGLATATSLGQPAAVTFDAAGNLVIGDTEFDRVWVVAPKTGTFYRTAMTAGHIYIVAGTLALDFSGSGGKATNAELWRGKFEPNSSVAVDGGNYVVVSTQQAWFIANSSGTYFGRVMAAGHIYSVAGNGLNGYAGDGGPATSAEFGNGVSGVTVDAAGNLVIADTHNSRIRVVAATTGTFYGQAMTAGDVYTVAGGGTAGLGDGGPATSAELNQPEGVTIDAAGNLVIADSFDARIRVVAEKTGTFYSQAMTAGDIYTVAGNGISGFAGDRGLATAARLRTPGGVAVDAAGNLVIADTHNQRIRVVAVTTGKFYRRPMTAGHIYTVAGIGTGSFSSGFSGDGGPANKAKMAFPQTVTVDQAGNLVIADTSNARIRVVAERTGTFYGVAMTAGDIYTVAGIGSLTGPLTGGCAASGDGGPATAARLCRPMGVAVDHAGDLVIADTGNARVRVVAG